MLKPLAEALTGWSPQASPADDPLAELTAAWPQIVGKDVARNSQPLHVSGDALVVVTRSSAWSEQLSFLAESILASIQRNFGLKEVQRLRFRVGKLSRRPAHVTRGTIGGRSKPKPRAARAPAASPEEALARFRADVAHVERAKRDAGWKQCSRCASLIPPGERAMCTACAVASSRQREGLVARLLFEVPWLGYDGIATIVEGLERSEYESIRSRVLARWWETLARAARTKQLSRDRRERLVASSYVIVRSGLEPESIAPATMRNLLGDEVFELLYEGKE